MTYEIAGSRVLITGGAGFVGSHIADALLDAGAAEIVSLDNLVRGLLRRTTPICSRLAISGDKSPAFGPGSV